MISARVVLLGFSIVLLAGCANTDRAITGNEEGVAPARYQGEAVAGHYTPGAGGLTQATAGASDAQASVPFNVDPGELEDYRIGPQDLLEIQVFGVEELTSTIRVNARGNIFLPLIGQVRAAGLTSEELAASIAAKLAEDYLQDPSVNIFIKEYTNQRVTIEGAVGRPGIYPIHGQTTLLQAIAQAEGVTKMASAGDVKLLRSQQPNGERQILSFSLDKIRNNEIVDPLLQGDDIIIVHTSAPRTVFNDVVETLRALFLVSLIF